MRVNFTLVASVRSIFFTRCECTFNLLHSVRVYFQSSSLGSSVRSIFFTRFECFFNLLHSVRAYVQSSSLGSSVDFSAGFTSRLEGMFRDMEISKDISSEFTKNYTRNECEISVNVLTSGIWPNFTYIDKVIYPAELEGSCPIRL